MARITFSIPDELQKAAETRATEDRRSLSAHIAILVERDARAAGLAPGDMRAELLAAAEDVGGIDKAVAVLKRAARKPKHGVAA